MNLQYLKGHIVKTSAISRLKGNKEAHTPNTTRGMGDYTGTGVKAPVGKVKVTMGMPNKTKSAKKAPRSLA